MGIIGGVIGLIQIYLLPMVVNWKREYMKLKCPEVLDALDRGIITTLKQDSARMLKQTINQKKLNQSKADFFYKVSNSQSPRKNLDFQQSPGKIDFEQQSSYLNVDLKECNIFIFSQMKFKQILIQKSISIIKWLMGMKTLIWMSFWLKE